MHKNSFITLLSVFVLLIVITGCSKAPQPVLIVGTAADSPPYTFIDTDTGDIIGLDIDLIEAIATRLDMAVTIQHRSWDSLLPALSAGQIDLIVSAITICDCFHPDLVFSDPYVITGQVIVAQQGDPYQSLTDVVHRNIGVVTTAEAPIAYRIPGVHKTRINKYAFADDAINALRRQSVDVLILDYITANYFIQTYPHYQIQMINQPFTLDFQGILLRATASDLRDQINQTLSELTATGQLEQLHGRWLVPDY